MKGNKERAYDGNLYCLLVEISHLACWERSTPFSSSIVGTSAYKYPRASPAPQLEQQSSPTANKHQFNPPNSRSITAKDGSLRPEQRCGCQLDYRRHEQRRRGTTEPAPLRQHIRPAVLPHKRLPCGRKLGQEGLHLRNQQWRRTGKVALRMPGPCSRSGMVQGTFITCYKL